MLSDGVLQALSTVAIRPDIERAKKASGLKPTETIQKAWHGTEKPPMIGSRYARVGKRDASRQAKSAWILVYIGTSTGRSPSSYKAPCDSLYGGRRLSCSWQAGLTSVREGLMSVPLVTP